MTQYTTSTVMISVITLYAIIIATTISANNDPSFCCCVPIIFCPNYGEGSIRPRVDNRTNAGCPEGQRYCCVVPQPDPNPTTPTPVLVPTTTTPVIVPTLPKCGIQNISSKVPGFNRTPSDLANFGEFPWLVRILGPKGNLLGSGALINENTVLTVAHVFDVKNRLKYPETVVLGEWNDAVDVKPYKPIYISVEKLVVHEDFNSDNLRNDIAVIHLASPVDLYQDHPNIGTVCLPYTTFDNERCLLSTYGDYEVPIVRKIKLPVIPSSRCQDKLKTTILGPGFILDSDSFICAGGESGKDACKGHGGAPLVCKVKGHYQVAGLVSWGLTDDFCNGKGELPGVYANVYNYVGWLKNNMK